MNDAPIFSEDSSYHLIDRKIASFKDYLKINQENTA